MNASWMRKIISSLLGGLGRGCRGRSRLALYGSFKIKEFVTKHGETNRTNTLQPLGLFKRCKGCAHEEVIKMDAVKNASVPRSSRALKHPVRLTALLYLSEALRSERYEECAEFVGVAREFGASENEIRGLLEDPRRVPSRK